ncbi:MAG TPA: cupin domain-containing protein [Candidatus Dormibacteraeota bacterium]|nr:cupin domain-containing protein [Candidatus Dormibacteraeota bacterium]
MNWDRAPQAIAMRAGADRQVVSGQHSSVVRVVTEPSAPFDGEQHRHANEQWLVVIRGRLRVSCEDQEMDVHPGELVFFPANSWHAAIGVGPDGCEYLEVSAPPRFDLLPGAMVPSPMEFRRPSGVR